MQTNFAEKTFVEGTNAVKFVKGFTRKSFRLYGMCVYMYVQGDNSLVYVCYVQGDVWICMELLDSSMDKISDRVYQQLKSTIPEEILGKMTVSVSQCIDMYTLPVYMLCVQHNILCTVQCTKVRSGFEILRIEG